MAAVTAVAAVAAVTAVAVTVLTVYYIPRYLPLRGNAAPSPELLPYFPLSLYLPLV